MYLKSYSILPINLLISNVNLHLSGMISTVGDIKLTVLLSMIFLFVIFDRREKVRCC